MFPEESRVREEATLAGWSETVGNGWALVFESPEDERLTLRVYPSFFEEEVTPTFLTVETRREPRWACRSGSASGFPHPRT